MAPLTIIISFILLFFFQMNETALLYSFKYREQKEPTYLGNIILNLYKKPGLYLLSLRWMSLIAFCAGTYYTTSYIESLDLFQNTTANLCRSILLAIIIYVGFGIILARVTGSKYANKALYYSAFSINLINSVSLPLTKLFVYIPKIFHIRITDTQLLALSGTRGITQETGKNIPQAENIKLHESNMKIYRNALEFSNVRVKDCIVPRTEIVGIEISNSQEELLQCFVKSGKSRIIVYQDNIDHIIGYFHSSDMFNKPADKKWTDFISEIPIVPEAMSAQKMMQIFLKEQKSLAIVADEYGGTSGIISLEDLVEEIFGEIEDEHDTVRYTARQLDKNEYLLSARLEIERVNELFSLDLPVSDEYATIGGFILFHYENFTKDNQIIDIGKFQFYIQKTSKTKIELVKLTVKSSE